MSLLTHHQTLDNQYLIKQNRKLRMELKQTHQLKTLHQQALIELNQHYPQSHIIKTLTQIINHSNNHSQTKQLNEYIMQLQAKVMVLQKISQQTEENQKETYNLLAQQFQKLIKENTRISEQLHKFYEKIGEVDYISGLVTKYKQIITTTEQAMAFKKQQEQLLDALNLQQETIKKIVEEKDKLFKINVFMKEEVERKKDQVRNMTIMLIGGQDEPEGIEGMSRNVLDQLQEHQHGDSNPSSTTNIEHHQLYAPSSERSTLSVTRLSKLNLSKMNTSSYNQQNTTINFIKMQRQLLKNVAQQHESNSSITNESQMDCPQLSILFPDKVQQIIKKNQQSKVPYLNMKKVREMMAKREEKMRKQWEQQKHHMNPTTKIIQLQTQLDITRKELSNQSLKFRLMEDQLKVIRMKIEQLQKRNQLLTESNFKLKTSYQVVYKDYQLCKSIAMEVERALGMTLGNDNEQKIRERLGMALAGGMKGSNQNEENREKQSINDKGKGNNKKKVDLDRKQEDSQKNQLQSTFRDQMFAKRLYDVLQFNGLRTNQHRRYYSA